MRSKTEPSGIQDLRSDFRVREHVTDTSPSHAEKRRPAVPGDKPKDKIHSCRETSRLTFHSRTEGRNHGNGAGIEHNRESKTNTYRCQVRTRRGTCTRRTAQTRRDRRHCGHRFPTSGPRQAGRGPVPTRRDSRRGWRLPCLHGTVLPQAPPRTPPSTSTVSYLTT
jgi:hypothetical protein